MLKAEAFTALMFLSTSPAHTVSMLRQGLHLLHGGSRRDYQVDIRQLYGVKVELAPSCLLGNGQVPRSATVEALLLAILDGHHACYKVGAHLEYLARFVAWVNGGPRSPTRIATFVALATGHI